MENIQNVFGSYQNSHITVHKGNNKMKQTTENESSQCVKLYIYIEHEKIVVLEGGKS